MTVLPAKKTRWAMKRPLTDARKVVPGGCDRVPVPVALPNWRGQDVVIAERREKALEFRRAGASYRRIARELRVSTETAWSDVQAELRSIRDACTTGTEDLREMERLRLDRLLLAAMTILDSPQADAEVKVKAIVAAVKVMAQRARLEGLDAPTKLEHSGAISGGATTLVDPAMMSTAELLSLRDLVRAQEARDQVAIGLPAAPATAR